MNKTLLLILAILSILVLSSVGTASTKVTVCHVPPGNPDNEQTIEVSEKAVDKHLDHGDYLGECGAEPEFDTCNAWGYTGVCATWDEFSEYSAANPGDGFLAGPPAPGGECAENEGCYVSSWTLGLG